MLKGMTSLGALAVAAAAASTTGSARADTTYLATHYRTLYRMVPERHERGMVIETFDLAIPVRGLCFDGSSVFGVVSQDGASQSDFVRLENAVTGTPSLTKIARLDRTYGSVTAVGDLFFGTAGGGYDLYSIDMSDPANPVETYIGSNPIGGNGASAYDPLKGIFYTVSKYTDTLYEVDLGHGGLEPVGHLGINDLSAGAEWFDGELFLAVQNGSSGDFEIGTLDVTTGAYDLSFVLEDGIADYVATGLAVVPEPTTLVLLLVAGLLPSRHPR